MDKHGFYRVAAASPRVAVADPARNKLAHEDLLRRAESEGCELVVFPELSLTGYTCGDLFASDVLLQSSLESLRSLVRESVECFTGVFVVGLPVRYRDRLYNTAAVIHAGRVLGLVAKQHLPNYREFYEQRWFEPASIDLDALVDLGLKEPVRLSCRQVFRDRRDARCALGVEICEDLWVPKPPSSTLAMEGATVLVNLSASNELATKGEYRRSLVLSQSARCIAGYVYAASSVTESTTDLVFGGHSMIAEDGAMLAEAARFERHGTLIVADLDLGRLSADRAKMTTFTRVPSGTESYHETLFHSEERAVEPTLHRSVPAHPFVPASGEKLHQRCAEIFQIQVAGLAKRLEKVQPERVTIGVSGGLDSTLALLVTVKALDLLPRPRSEILGITMPGFGTSQRTRTNALAIMNHLEVSAETIDIRPMTYDAFRVLGHRPFGLDPKSLSFDEFTEALVHLPEDNRVDLVFENVQARLRTLVLMSRGFVVGTGDLSELALGWTTYNADHMSMYNPNVGVPKTLVRFLVRWVADHEFKGEASQVLHSIADTPISPELLPITRDGQVQRTEDTVGPYELNDFFLYHIVRFGFAPSKIVRLAGQAEFEKDYSANEIRDQLKSFLKRFFSQQFKRSCLPDGPKVGSICLSPRGDWRMPSDAEVSAWIAELDNPL